MLHKVYAKPLTVHINLEMYEGLKEISDSEQSSMGCVVRQMIHKCLPCAIDQAVGQPNSPNKNNESNILPEDYYQNE